MININLIIKPPPLVRWRTVLVIGVAFAILGLLGIAAIGWGSELRAAQQELSDTQALLADYTRVGNRLPEVQEALEVVQAERSLVEQIGRNQRFSQAAVLKILTVTPPEVALSQLTFSGTGVTITGRSRTFDGAMRYLNYLKAQSSLLGVLEENLITIDTGQTSFTYSVRIREEVEQP